MIVLCGHLANGVVHVLCNSRPKHSQRTSHCMNILLTSDDKILRLSITQVAGYGNKYLRPEGETRVKPAHIQAAVDGNLARLGVDHIDLLQVCSIWSVMPYDMHSRQQRV